MRPAIGLLGLLVVAVTTLLCAPRLADACTCMSAEGPGDAFTRAKVVFVGTVGAVNRIQDDLHETTFAVEEVFRGKPGKTAVVASRWNGGSCDYAVFTAGTRMLIYAIGDAKLYVSACSGTKPLAQAADDLAYLRHARKAKTAMIEGAVHLWSDPRQASEKVPRANVLVRARGTAYVARTGADGTYRLELPPGKYILDIVDVEPGLSTGGVPVELPEIATWARGDFSEAWNGRIRGQLRDHAGQPAANVFVRALPAGGRDPTSLDGRTYSSAHTDANGNYEIPVVPEGNYRVAVSVPFDPSFPVPSTYYPGVPTRAQARTVTMPRGGLVEHIDFALPAPERLFTLTGVVARARKLPSYPNAVVNIVNTGARRTSKDSALGDDAKFSFREVAGAVLEVHACDGPLGEGTCTDPITVTLDQDRHVTLTLPE